MLLRNIIQNVEEIWKKMIQCLFKIILEYCLTGLSTNHLVPLSECTSDPVFLPRESHEQRSLAGQSPWDSRVGHD